MEHTSLTLCILDGSSYLPALPEQHNLISLISFFCVASVVLQTIAEICCSIAFTRSALENCLQRHKRRQCHCSNVQFPGQLVPLAPRGNGGGATSRLSRRLQRKARRKMVSRYMALISRRGLVSGTSISCGARHQIQMSGHTGGPGNSRDGWR